MSLIKNNQQTKKNFIEGENYMTEIEQYKKHMSNSKLFEELSNKLNLIKKPERKDKTDPEEIADILILHTKEWSRLCDKFDKHEYVRRFDKESGLFLYELANPGEKAGEIKEHLKSLKPELLEQVMAVIEKISLEADKGIEENNGSWNCEAGKIKKACNAIKTFHTIVSEEQNIHTI